MYKVYFSPCFQSIMTWSYNIGPIIRQKGVDGKEHIAQSSFPSVVAERWTEKNIEVVCLTFIAYATF